VDHVFRLYCRARGLVFREEITVNANAFIEVARVMAIRLPISSLATWPPTNTKPPALVASERGSVLVPTLLSGEELNRHFQHLSRATYVIQ